MKKSSATQLETLSLCPRKWWFSYRARMPQAGDRSSLIKGSALHACAERYLLGQEIFPEGWDAELEAVDSLMIRLLINKAIEAGTLERRPHSVVEAESLLPAPPTDYHLIVKKDYSQKARVEDHKTGKSARYFKKTDKALKGSLQMMIYAKDLVHQAQVRGEVLTSVELVHNHYLLDPEGPEVSRTSCVAAREEVEEFWDQSVLPLIRQQALLQEVENPFDILDPPASACRAFGGCPYVSICSGMEDPQAYRDRVSRILANQTKKTMTEIQPVKPADLLAKRARQAAPAAPVAAINPPAPEASKTPEPPKTPSSYTPPPWTLQGCPACKGNKSPGFNETTGKPCRICLTKTKGSVEGISYESHADGTITWWKGDKPVAQSAPVAPAADKGNKFHYGSKDLHDDLVKAQETEDVLKLIDKAPEVLGDTPELKIFLATADKRLDKLAELEAIGPVEEAAPPVKFEPPPEPVAPVAPTEKKGPGRPAMTAEQKAAAAAARASAKGFTLCVGCVPVKADPAKVIFAEDLLRKQFEGYWTDPAVFDRRGRVRTAVEAGDLALALADMTVVQIGRDPDVDNLISSLLPHAAPGRVFRGTGV